MSKRIEGYCYLAAAMLLVGSTVVAARLIGAGLAPFTATALRFAIALPVFVVAMAATGARLPALGRRDWAVLAVQAVAGSVGYTVLLIMGTRLTSAADAGVIIGTLPVVAATISVVVLGERPGRRLLVAIALAAAGLAAIAIAGGGQNDGDANGGWNRLAGNALILGAVVCEGLFILLNKRIRTAIQPLALSTIMTGFGLIAAAIPAVFEARPPILDPAIAAASGTALLAVLYYALVPTVAGFVLWYAGAARVTGSEAALFTSLAPVSAVVLAALVLGEPVGPVRLAGIACVLAAVAGLNLTPGQVPNWASCRRR
ncbi:DMT family transporter [Tistrella sp. BH-R2-4]|uniref:DMT family transporter n=1 Tax=Tistrella arctica TaxID=3133430 RepID=A0ABU9YLR9_9PROT